VLLLIVTTNAVPRALIVSGLKMEAIRSSETSVLTGTTRRHIPEDGILQATYQQNIGFWYRSEKMATASVVGLSEFLGTVLEVPGSIHGATRFYE
jgi:hypothetical protein